MRESTQKYCKIITNEGVLNDYIQLFTYIVKYALLLCVGQYF